MLQDSRLTQDGWLHHYKRAGMNSFVATSSPYRSMRTSGAPTFPTGCASPEHVNGVTAPRYGVTAPR